MKNYKLLLGSALFLLFTLAKIESAHAQEPKYCGTDENRRRLFAAHPEMEQEAIEYEKAIQKQLQDQKYSRSTDTTSIFYIPVVFHVIHTNGNENISDAQIQSEITNLNINYRKLNVSVAQIIPGFELIAADIRIQFRLATIDPNGNCTNGIDRIYSHLTNNADDNSKLNPWPHEKYLNVWTIKNFSAAVGAGVLAYATFPSSNIYGIPAEGVIMVSNVVGTLSGMQYSSTLTHEIGHYLNLHHPWGDGAVATACGDDGVDDTPVTKGHQNACSATDLNIPVCTINSISNPYTFSKVTPVSGVTDTTAVPVTSAKGVAMGFFKANGVAANSTDSSRFSFANWGTGATNGDTTYTNLTGSINTSKYYEVTITPNSRWTLSLTGITFSFQRSATGVRSYAVRSSVDGYTNNLAASNGGDTLLRIAGSNEFFCIYDTTSKLDGSTITLSGASYTNTRSPITFRFYGWNAEDAAGTFSIDNVSFNGTVGAIENIQNYMDYSWCLPSQSMFTRGQRDRMRAALRNNVDQRDNLSISSNLTATGTDGGPTQTCVPHPDFYANRYNICTGGTITFTKNVTMGTPTGNPVWSFPGGTPSTSTAANPSVTYNTPGNYDVKLVATNSAGTDSVVKTMLIRVSGVADIYGLYSEPFEPVTNDFYWAWEANNLDGNPQGWYYVNVGYNSNHSFEMYANGDYPRDVDELISPSFDLSNISNATLTFMCAGASKALSATDLNDSLSIYSSTTCGQSWLYRGSVKGNSLNNNGYHSEDFVPNATTAWSMQTITIPPSVATSNVRFKFVYNSGNKSNNIYIDDVNINGTVGIKENTLTDANLSIYPNPANQTSTIAYHLNKKSNVTITLVDVLGKKLMELNNNSQAEGDYSFLVSKQENNLNNGIYFIKFSIDDKSITKKLIITE